MVGTPDTDSIYADSGDSLAGQTLFLSGKKRSGLGD